jgi:cytidylate kinase
MYRAVALYCIENGIITSESINEKQLENDFSLISIEFNKNSEGKSEIFLNGENVENKIRSLSVAECASKVSTLGFVRRGLVYQQQLMGLNKGIVMDGRDIGTVVFPNAELKIFLTASVETRAQRRFEELRAKGEKITFENVLVSVKERDHRDTNRTESPLVKATDAVEIDNTNISIEEQNLLIKTLFESRVL